jgi:two-component system, cell cycle response regulator CtrA
MRILLADQDFSTGRSIRAALLQGGFTVATIDDMDDVASFSRHEEFDVILLVAPRNATDPYRLASGMRRAGVDAPMMMVGAGQALDVVRALNAGADEVLHFPFDSAELIARCRAMARRARGFIRRELTVGELSLDLEARQARVFGRSLNLTGKEFAVLELLTLRRRSVVRKDAMLSQLYSIDEAEPDQKIIDVFICKLRKKLAAVGAPHLISTVWGVGYRLEELGQGDDRLGATQEGTMRMAS